MTVTDEIDRDDDFRRADDLARAERKAVALFMGSVVAAAIVVAGITVADWGGGILDNRVEPLFWAGAILGGIALALLGLATMPRRSPGVITALSRAGTLLFLVAPTLCIVAIFMDYWI